MANLGTRERGAFGWVILLVALAIPGMLFFNWWSHLKADQERGAAGNRGRHPLKNIFQTPPPSIKINAPLTPQMPTPAKAEALPPAASPLISKPIPSVDTGTVIAPSAAVLSSATLVLTRDPMLSPLDVVRIREAELKEESRKQTLKRGRQHVGRQERPIDRQIELQGIIAKPGGASLAIVNGEVRAVRAAFSVPGYAHKLMIIKIKTDEVTFEYNKRRFKKMFAK